MQSKVHKIVGHKAVSGGKKRSPKAGATQTTPSMAQYFSWINNTNEGATEQQTMANLAFFQWLQDSLL